MSDAQVLRNREIIRLSKEGLTSTQIALRLGLASRNVVIGVLARAKAAGDREIPSRKPGRRRLKQAEAEAKRQQEAEAAKLRAAAEEAEKLRKQAEEKARRIKAMSEEQKASASIRWVQPNTLDPSQGVGILNVRHGQCRTVMPYKHEGLAVFCGDAVLPGKSFCAEHHKLYYTSSTNPQLRIKPKLSVRSYA